MRVDDSMSPGRVAVVEQLTPTDSVLLARSRIQVVPLRAYQVREQVSSAAVDSSPRSSTWVGRLSLLKVVSVRVHRVPPPVSRLRDRTVPTFVNYARSGPDVAVGPCRTGVVMLPVTQAPPAPSRAVCSRIIPEYASWSSRATFWESVTHTSRTVLLGCLSPSIPRR